MIKDTLQLFLQGYCINQQWIKKQVARKVEIVEKINPYSISSVKQILK
jgi:hypothetical protein